MKTHPISLLTGLFCLYSALLQAQNSLQSPQRLYQIAAPKLEEKIVLDGELSEAIWQNSPRIGDFYQSFPMDTCFALSKTEVMMAFDDNFVYVSAICYDELPGKPVVQSLRRDFDPDLTDFFTVYFDCFGDGQNGFTFGMSALGVQREGLIVNGAEIANDWDNKWYGTAKLADGKYYVEMAIPFKTLRFKEGSKTWKVNFARIDRKRNEVSSWVPVPRNFRTSSLAYTGELQWAEPLQKTGGNISVIPYISGGTSKNHIAGKDAAYQSNVGADVKIAVTSSLNLDLTFNPDFSQVEVDQQVTNLDRFELFFPERRQFFLENQDLFSQFGFRRIRPFFSRRIGIGKDTNTGTIVQNPILYGARLSGKLDKNWRVGLLNMQTARDADRGIDGQNYTVATFQRRVFARSNFAGIFVNRTRTSTEQSDFTLNSGDFTRIVGLDYNLASKNDRWQGKFFFHQLLTPNNRSDQYTHGSFLRRSTKTLELMWNHEYVGTNYNPNDIGFVPRRGVWRIEPYVNFRFFPKKTGAKLNHRGLESYHNVVWNTNGKLLDRFDEIGLYHFFNSSMFFGFWFSNTYTQLVDGFDPTNTGGAELPANSEFTNTRLYMRFESNSRKLFSFEAGLGVGEFWNGTNTQMDGRFIYRIQPFGIISLSYNYNQIRLPEPYNDADFWLLGPRFDLTFTRNVFFTLFTQYNTQSDNVNVNARLQWRFKPVSDFFLVYTDNYFPDNFKVKNRALVAKLTYWLNL
jgi:hypothetical protein